MCKLILILKDFYTIEPFFSFDQIRFHIFSYFVKTSISHSDIDIPGKPTTPPPVDDCAPERLTCRNKNCYTHLQKCNFIDDCGDNSDEENCGTSCDFENGTCGWYNPLGYRGNWTIKSGKANWYGNLNKDHTLGTEEEIKSLKLS
ncbi:UNVERIFIED_CONTAM: Malrd1 [Trichonephila clavipes]